MSLPPLVEPAAELTVDEVRRYSRHLIIPDVGMAGQKRLKNAKVLCVGAGGLGSPALMYLAAAGVGTLGIIDFDVVDESNLQRQIIHGQSDVGRPKAESAAATVREINPLVDVVIHNTALTTENVMEIFSGYDLIVDGTDNFATRYMVNDAAVLLGKPYVWGSIYRFDGQASVFWAEHGPCYRCLYPEPPPPGMVPSCAEGGVLGVLCASIGSIQVNEAIKLLTGIGDPLVGRLMIYDALEMKYRDVKVRKDPECVLCGKNPTVTELLEDYEAFCGTISDEGRRGSLRLDDHGPGAQGDAGRRRGHLPHRRPRAERVRDRLDPGRDADPQGRVPERLGPGEAAPGQAHRAALQVGRPLRRGAGDREERRLLRRRPRGRRRAQLGQDRRPQPAQLLTTSEATPDRGTAARCPCSVWPRHAARRRPETLSRQGPWPPGDQCALQEARPHQAKLHAPLLSDGGLSLGLPH
ncbi:hypothetical protein GCM10020219_089330 [Nonomuraea dietziae]